MMLTIAIRSHLKEPRTSCIVSRRMNIVGSNIWLFLTPLLTGYASVEGHVWMVEFYPQQAGACTPTKLCC